MVKVSIIFSYWLRPPALSGTSPDIFVEAEHNIWEFLDMAINKSLALQINNVNKDIQAPVKNKDIKNWPEYLTYTEQ